jgi:hypothetical protein
MHYCEEVSMPALRWRSSLFLILLAAFALCSNGPVGQLVSAKDKTVESAASSDSADEPDTKSGKARTKASAAKKKSRPESARKKKDAGGGDDSNQGTTNSGSSSGGSAIPAPGGSGSNAGPADAKSGSGNQGASSSGVPRSSGRTPAGKNSGNGQKGGAAGNGAPGAQPGPNPELVAKVMAIQDRATPDLIKQKGIVGTATGLDDDGNVVIQVYTTGADDPKIPATIENIPVVEIQSGPWNFRWQPPAFDPKLRQPRPVPIGVSAISTNGACLPIIATGTLGCRLRSKDGGIFALSNNHVFAAENAGVIGDPIIQPGSLDENILNICDSADVIGNLFKFKPYVVNGVNVMDAAVMKTDASQVGNSTPPPPTAYGTPRTTVNNRPYLGLRVQKLGRTTGYTTGTITGLNQTVLVGGTVLGVLTFVKQIVIVGDGPLPFSAAGDSGSLIVDMDRFPVALLFAGSAIRTDANPIQTVLDEFDMTIDGDGSPVVPPGKEARSTPNSP